jgi:hypothetical protein
LNENVAGVAVEDWLGLPLPMEGIKSSSIVFNRLAPIIREPYACFCAEDDRGCHLELYPRPNGKIVLMLRVRLELHVKRRPKLHTKHP